MRRTVLQLTAVVVGAVLVGVAACTLLPFGGLSLNPVPTILGLVAAGLVGWTVYHGFDSSASVVWPVPGDASIASPVVHEVGLIRSLALFASADAGSALSKADVAALLRDATARQLELRGADPADPFAAADDIVGKDLLALCRRSAAGHPVPNLSRRRLDAYLKEILAL